MEKEIKVREDLNGMVEKIGFANVGGRFSDRKVVQVCFWNGDKVNFRDKEGLYDLFATYKKLGQTDYLKSASLVEDTRAAITDVLDDEPADEITNTYVCVLFELKSGRKYRVFPERRTDRAIIDLLYEAWKKHQKEQKTQNKQ